MSGSNVIVKRTYMDYARGPTWCGLIPGADYTEKKIYNTPDTKASIIKTNLLLDVAEILEQRFPFLTKEEISQYCFYFNDDVDTITDHISKKENYYPYQTLEKKLITNKIIKKPYPSCDISDISNKSSNCSSKNNSHVIETEAISTNNNNVSSIEMSADYINNNSQIHQEFKENLFNNLRSTSNCHDVNEWLDFALLTLHDLHIKEHLKYNAEIKNQNILLKKIVRKHVEKHEKLSEKIKKAQESIVKISGQNEGLKKLQNTLTMKLNQTEMNYVSQNNSTIYQTKKKKKKTKY